MEGGEVGGMERGEFAGYIRRCVRWSTEKGWRCVEVAWCVKPRESS